MHSTKDFFKLLAGFNYNFFKKLFSSVDSGTGSHHPSQHFIVVAIDFGTTYSGYAFSFTRDPDTIHMMRKVEGRRARENHKINHARR